MDDSEEDKERTPKKARAMRMDKVSSAKDPESANASKNPIISVVLTSHEAIPGEIHVRCTNGWVIYLN